jgi:hypothetical protein
MCIQNVFYFGEVAQVGHLYSNPEQILSGQYNLASDLSLVGQVVLDKSNSLKEVSLGSILTCGDFDLQYLYTQFLVDSLASNYHLLGIRYSFGEPLVLAKKKKSGAVVSVPIAKEVVPTPSVKLVAVVNQTNLAAMESLSKGLSAYQGYALVTQPELLDKLNVLKINPEQLVGTTASLNVIAKDLKLDYFFMLQEIKEKSLTLMIYAVKEDKWYKVQYNSDELKSENEFVAFWEKVLKRVII